MMRFTLAGFLLVLALLGTTTLLWRAPNNSDQDEHPIIAQLFSKPESYAGRSVMVYGLVVESLSGTVFMLQDVSQRPLKIVGGNNIKASVGDQIIVTGIFLTSPEGPYISARSLIATQVLAGGGCC
jgi:hypothetical protein